MRIGSNSQGPLWPRLVGMHIKLYLLITLFNLQVQANATTSRCTERLHSSCTKWKRSVDNLVLLDELQQQSTDLASLITPSNHLSVNQIHQVHSNATHGRNIYESLLKILYHLRSLSDHGKLSRRADSSPATQNIKSVDLPSPARQSKEANSADFESLHSQSSPNREAPLVVSNSSVKNTMPTKFQDLGDTVAKQPVDKALHVEPIEFNYSSSLNNAPADHQTTVDSKRESKNLRTSTMAPAGSRLQVGRVQESQTHSHAATTMMPVFRLPQSIQFSPRDTTRRASIDQSRYLNDDMDDTEDTESGNSDSHMDDLSGDSLFSITATPNQRPFAQKMAKPHRQTQMGSIVYSTSDYPTHVSAQSIVHSRRTNTQKPTRSSFSSDERLPVARQHHQLMDEYGPSGGDLVDQVDQIESDRNSGSHRFSFNKPTTSHESLRLPDLDPQDIQLQQVYPATIDSTMTHEPAMSRSRKIIPNRLRGSLFNRNNHDQHNSRHEGTIHYGSSSTLSQQPSLASFERLTTGNQQMATNFQQQQQLPPAQQTHRDLLNQPQTIQITAIPNTGLGSLLNNNNGPLVRINGLQQFGGLGQNGLPWNNGFLDSFGRPIFMVNAERRQIDWSIWIWPIVAVVALPLILGALFVPVFLKTVVVLIQILQSLGLLLPLANALGQQVITQTTGLAASSQQVEQGQKLSIAN